MLVHTIRSSNDFNNKLTKAGDKLVVVKFYATWCDPCKKINPKLKALAKKYADRTIVLKVNVDKFENIASYYKVNSMPTFIFIKNGEKVDDFTGAYEKKLANKMAKG